MLNLKFLKNYKILNNYTEKESKNYLLYFSRSYFFNNNNLNDKNSSIKIKSFNIKCFDKFLGKKIFQIKKGKFKYIKLI
jgi:hypothetical protein